MKNPLIVVSITSLAVLLVAAVAIIVGSRNTFEVEDTITFTLGDNSDPDGNVAVSPPVIYLDNLNPGEEYSQEFSVYYAGSPSEFTVDLLNFDINREDCSDRRPTFEVATGNSFKDNFKVRGFKMIEVDSSQREASFELRFIPIKTEQTYWAGINISPEIAKESVTRSISALAFLTVGEERSERCLVETT